MPSCIHPIFPIVARKWEGMVSHHQLGVNLLEVSGTWRFYLNLEERFKKKKNTKNCPKLTKSMFILNPPSRNSLH